MEKENEIKTVVPALRFPEFQGMIGWEKTYIYEECPNPYSGGTPKTTEKKYYGGNIPFIRSAEIGKDKTELSITQEGLNNSSAKMIQKGDLLIALYGANSGDIAISKIDGAINQAILCLKAKSNNLFIYYTLLKKQKDIVSKYLQGGQGNLSGEIIKSIDFYIPQKIEQQKIAECLSSLDELIEATTQKVKALKEYKKGLMQRLFPVEGKNVPDLRFPEFQETSVWEEKKLGDIVEIKGRIGFRGYTTKDIVEQGNGAISLSPTNITDNGNLNFEKSTYISWEKYEESPEIQLKKGYIVLVKTGSSYGKSALIKELPTKTTVNPQIVVLKPEEGVNKYFLSVLISHPMIQKQIKSTVVGGAIPTLSQESISKFDILYPKKAAYKPSEQQKIAECLSSLDELIEATSQKVEILKEHKKGLMQQLFPKI